VVKGTCLRWLESGAPDHETLHGFLAGAYLGCLEAAVGVDADCAPALAALAH